MLGQVHNVGGSPLSAYWTLLKISTFPEVAAAICEFGIFNNCQKYLDLKFYTELENKFL